ncbi:MAG TPA: DUF1565 domain-containing protein [Dehalococcoidia bacterium]|nr:DUF1565 domain-containing protein [Dehalococcoidia bacterium]
MIAGPRLLRRLATAVLLVALAGMVSTEQRQAAAGPPLQCTTDCYVATTGSDSNDGSQASPFLTIQKALDTVQDGGTVHVAPGAYDAMTRNTIDKNVTLLGARAGVDPVGRDPTDASTESIVRGDPGFQVTADVNVTIDGFTFQELDSSTAIITAEE